MRRGREQERRERNFCPRGNLDKTLPLGRWKTDVANEGL